jgi:hypothetical protein
MKDSLKLRIWSIFWMNSFLIPYICSQKLFDMANSWWGVSSKRVCMRHRVDCVLYKCTVRFQTLHVAPVWVAVIWKLLTWVNVFVVTCVLHCYAWVPCVRMVFIQYYKNHCMQAELCAILILSTSCRLYINVLPFFTQFLFPSSNSHFGLA